MNKTDLADLTFLIPVRIDSVERHDNLNLVLEFIKSNFDTTIIVLEADEREIVKNTLIDEKIFVLDSNPIFYRTKYLNQMTKSTISPFLAIWDTDVILNNGQIIESLNILRRKKADMVFPYDGAFYNVPPILAEMYKSFKEIKILEENIGKLYLMNGNQSVGGAFLVNRSSYCEAGMENENFYGWGPEDAERVKRWEILGYKINRTSGPLFHLHHPRNINSQFSSKEIEIHNKKEFLKVCSMNKEQLVGYLPSLKGSHVKNTFIQNNKRKKTNTQIEIKDNWEKSLISDELDFWLSWLQTKGLQWKSEYLERKNPDSCIQSYITPYLKNGKEKILDVGAGPLTILGKKHKGISLDISACDALADQYNMLLAKFSINPPVKTVKCEMEKLTYLYGGKDFDIIHARNCVDHSYNPILAIKEMLQCISADGIVFLRHKINEANNACFAGLHQWNFFEDRGNFMIGGQESIFNVTALLKDLCIVDCNINDTYINCVLRKID